MITHIPPTTSHMLEFVDQGGTQHHLLVTPDRVLLDEHAFVKRITVSDTTIRITSDTSTHTVTCTPMALWQACAGHTIEPTILEAGRLLAAVLAGLVEKQQLQVMVRTMQDGLSQRCEEAAQILPRQRQRLDPFTEQCLERCDGTAAGIQAVAQLLDVTSEQITLWGQQRGKSWAWSIFGDAPSPTPEAARTSTRCTTPLDEQVGEHQNSVSLVTAHDSPDDQPSPQHTQHSQEHAPLPPKRTFFYWDIAMIERLRVLFAQIAPQHTTLSGVINAIAQQTDWPVKKIEYQCLRLKLNETFRQGSQGTSLNERDPDHETEKENPPADSAPCEPTVTPVEALPLPPGAVLWDVRIGSGETAQQQRWRLDFPYGNFPYRQGQQVSYNDHQYHIERVYSSQLMVCQI